MHWSIVPLSQGKINSGSDSEEHWSISYATLCEELQDIYWGGETLIQCKVAFQEKQNKPIQQELELHSSVIEILSKVTSSEMKDAQQADPTTSQICAVGEGRK